MHRNRLFRFLIAAGSVVVVGAAAAVAQIGPTGPTVDEIFGDKTNETSKEEIIREDETLIAIGEANPPPKEDPQAARPTDDPEDVNVWVEGIFQGGHDFPSGAGYDFHTVWQGTDAGMNVRVYAGALADDPSRGIVLVDIVDPGTWGHTFKGPFEAPIPGPLRIVDAKGAILTLSGKGGTSVEFDAAALAFR